MEEIQNNEIPDHTEPLLANLLENQDKHHKTTQDILAHQTVQNSKRENLAATNIEMQAKTQDTIEKSGSEVAKAVESLKPVMDAAGFIANFLAAIRGDKGDKGDSVKGDKGDSIKGDKGDKGDSVKGDKGDSIKGDKGDPGKNGYTPIKNKDYFDGEDANPVDIQLIIKEVLAKIPKPKLTIDHEEIIKKVKKQLSYTDLKDAPDFRPSFPKLAGTGFLREISDVNVTGLVNGQVLIWNVATNKWIPGTASGGTGGGILTTASTVDGTNMAFVFVSATAQPSAIYSDGVQYLAIRNSDGLTNWTWNQGTKTATFTSPQMSPPTISVSAVA